MAFPEVQQREHLIKGKSIADNIEIARTISFFFGVGLSEVATIPPHMDIGRSVPYTQLMLLTASSPGDVGIEEGVSESFCELNFVS